MTRTARRRSDAVYPARRIQAIKGIGTAATRTRSTPIVPAEAPTTRQGVNATLLDRITFDNLSQFAPPAAGTPSEVVDHILLKGEIGNAIDVHVPLSQEIDVGEDVTLILNGIDLETKQVPVDSDFSPMAFTIPAEKKFLDGINFLNYRLDYINGSGGSDFGPGDELIVDTIPPGGAHPIGAPEVDPAIVEGGLTQNNLVTLPDGTTRGLLLKLPGYEDFAYGDKITGIANDRIDTVVTEIQYGHTGEIQAYVTEATIKAAGDGRIAFKHKIVDRAGNESVPSNPLYLDVVLKGVENLEPVGVPDYDDDPSGEKLIDLADATQRDGVAVIVPWNTSFEAADSIALFWGGSAIAPYTITAEDVSAAEDITIGVMYPAIYDEWEITAADDDRIVAADVIYMLKRGKIELGRSPPKTVEVNVFEIGGGDPDPETPGNDNLQKPVLLTDSGVRNRVEGADFGKPAKVEVAKQTRGPDAKLVFQIADVLIVTYHGTALTEHIITQADLEAPVDTPIVIDMAADVITDAGSGTLDLQYGIRRVVQGGENTTLSTVQQIVVHGKDELPGDGLELRAGLHPEGDDKFMDLSKVNDGTLVALPIWTQFNAETQEVTVTGKYFTARENTPIPARAFSLKVPSPLLVVPAETMPQPEPDGPTRPPVEENYVAFRIPRDRLVYLVPENRYFYIEVTYAVNNKVGDTTPVASAKTIVKVDTRGS